MLPVTVMVYWPATEDEEPPPEDDADPELELTPHPTGINNIARKQKTRSGQRRRRRARNPNGNSKARVMPGRSRKEDPPYAV